MVATIWRSPSFTSLAPKARILSLLYSPESYWQTPLFGPWLMKVSVVFGVLGHSSSFGPVGVAERRDEEPEVSKLRANYRGFGFRVRSVVA